MPLAFNDSLLLTELDDSTLLVWTFALCPPRVGQAASASRALADSHSTLYQQILELAEASHHPWELALLAQDLKRAEERGMPPALLVRRKRAWAVLTAKTTL
ncbi:hypothetical protein LIER_23893 [Lithospermum erythrorhizon]|uniref:Uncharacterized protein n=1 Tax=Lithospermum erythrorhizon TaxID=34254 RepID=A0AAV3R287_LITER